MKTTETPTLYEISFINPLATKFKLTYIRTFNVSLAVGRKKAEGLQLYFIQPINK